MRLVKGSSPWDYEVSENLQDASVRTPLLIAVVLAILLVLLCLLDFACCRINKVGIMWTLTSKTCGKKKRAPSLTTTVVKSAISEKQPLNEALLDARESLRPVGDGRNGHNGTHGRVPNGKTEHSTVSDV